MRVWFAWGREGAQAILACGAFFSPLVFSRIQKARHPKRSQRPVCPSANLLVLISGRIYNFDWPPALILGACMGVCVRMRYIYASEGNKRDHMCNSCYDEEVLGSIPRRGCFFKYLWTNLKQSSPVGSSELTSWATRWVTSWVSSCITSWVPSWVTGWVTSWTLNFSLSAGGQKLIFMEEQLSPSPLSSGSKMSYYLGH